MWKAGLVPSHLNPLILSMQYEVLSIFMWFTLDFFKIGFPECQVIFFFFKFILIKI